MCNTRSHPWSDRTANRILFRLVEIEVNCQLWLASTIAPYNVHADWCMCVNLIRWYCTLSVIIIIVIIVDVFEYSILMYFKKIKINKWINKEGNKSLISLDLAGPHSLFAICLKYVCFIVLARWTKPSQTEIPNRDIRIMRQQELCCSRMSTRLYKTNFRPLEKQYSYIDAQMSAMGLTFDLFIFQLNRYYYIWLKSCRGRWAIQASISTKRSTAMIQKINKLPSRFSCR